MRPTLPHCSVHWPHCTPALTRLVQDVQRLITELAKRADRANHGQSALARGGRACRGLRMFKPVGRPVHWQRRYRESCWKQTDCCCSFCSCWLCEYLYHHHHHHHHHHHFTCYMTAHKLRLQGRSRKFLGHYKHTFWVTKCFTWRPPCNGQTALTYTHGPVGPCLNLFGGHSKRCCGKWQSLIQNRIRLGRGGSARKQRTSK